MILELTNLFFKYFDIFPLRCLLLFPERIFIFKNNSENYKNNLNVKLNRKDLVLRQPIGKKGIGVEHLQKIIGKKINRNKKAYDFINKKDLKS